MADISRPQNDSHHKGTDDVGPSITSTNMATDEKSPAVDGDDAVSDKAAELRNTLPDEDAQRGVRMAEAITLTWTKQSLIFVFIKYIARLCH